MTRLVFFTRTTKAGYAAQSTPESPALSDKSVPMMGACSGGDGGAKRLKKLEAALLLTK